MGHCIHSFEFPLACQFNLNYIFPQAEVVELADTLCSGRSEVTPRAGSTPAFGRVTMSPFDFSQI